VRSAGAHPGTDELGDRIGGPAHLEWPVLEAPAKLGKIGHQTAVLLHSFDDGIPAPAARLPTVKEDDCGRPDWTRFAHKQVHAGDRIRSPT
jgi:hypothetical protein